MLPIGGLKEKILAARRAGIDTILCPKLNKKELDEVPAQLRRGLTVHLVETVDEVLDARSPAAARDEAAAGDEDAAAPVPGPAAAAGHGLAGGDRRLVAGVDAGIRSQGAASHRGAP